MKERITSKYTLWKVGEKVWLETTNLHMNGPKKLQMRRTSPFEIEEVISRTAFHLRIPSQWKIHPVFHASLLTSYKETSEHGVTFFPSISLKPLNYLRFVILFTLTQPCLLFASTSISH